MGDYPPEILIKPEDDPNRQLAIGFLQHFAVDDRRLKVLPVAGGWLKAVDWLRETGKDRLKRRPNRQIVVMIDGDGDADRFAKATEDVPETLRDRVFVIGCRREPEQLKREVGGSYEQIGTRLANGCHDKEYKLWRQALPSTAAETLERLQSTLRPLIIRQ